MIAHSIRFFLHLAPDIIRIRDGTVEVVGIGRTAATAVKSGKAIPTFVFRIDIAELELVADCRVGHARIHVAEQEIFVSYKLMARIEVAPRGNCQILSS